MQIPAIFFRLLFIPIQILCTYYIFSIPNPELSQIETDKYRSDDKLKTTLGESGFTIRHAVRTYMYMTWAILIFEIIVLGSITGITLSPQLSLSFNGSITQYRAHALQLHLSAALIIAGTIIRVASYRHLGRFFTLQLAIRDGHKLVKDGPYRVVRHPAYTGGLLALLWDLCYQLGPASIWAQLGLWQSIPACIFGVTKICLAAYINVVALMLRVNEEDRVLREQFRGEWEAWARQTQYKLVPFVY